MSKQGVTIGVIGAGGKMGGRITDNLVNTNYNVLYCEKAEKGVEVLEEKGLTVSLMEEVTEVSDFLILAVPDTKIKVVSEKVVPEMKEGATLILLDPAAAYAEDLALRDDCTFIVTHPCHPALFSEQDTPEAKKDYFGGVAAKQDIVIALIQGDESNFQAADEICKKIFAPVVNSYRITVEQMALLEPAAAEVVIASAAVIMKEALDEVVKRGVPEEAARSFLLGHTQIPLAIAFNEISSPFSDAAKVAIKVGHDKIFKENWKEVFEPEVVKKTIDYMLHPEKVK